MTLSHVIASLQLLLAHLAVSTVHAQTPTGHEIVERVETLLWGKTLQAEMEMTVTTPRWRRTLSLQTWIERPRRSFVRILAPAKEQGIGSLMMQPWMGSDFTNDDLVKESSPVADYDHRVVRTEGGGDSAVYVVEAIPKPDAAVVRGRIMLRARKSDLLPVSEEFYDERGQLMSVMTFSDVRTPVDG